MLKSGIRDKTAFIKLRTYITVSNVTVCVQITTSERDMLNRDTFTLPLGHAQLERLPLGFSKDSVISIAKEPRCAVLCSRGGFMVFGRHNHSPHFPHRLSSFFRQGWPCVLREFSQPLLSHSIESVGSWNPVSGHLSHTGMGVLDASRVAACRSFRLWL